MRLVFKKLITIFLIILSVLTCYAENATDIIRKANLAEHYAGNDLKSRIAMLVYYEGMLKPNKKIFNYIKKDVEDGGKQKYFLYFTYPPDIQKAAFIVHKHIKNDDYRRLYLPASQKILIINGEKKQCPFMGSDFSAEDITGRHETMDFHRLIQEEILTISSGKQTTQYSTYVIESIPKVKEDKTNKTITWIDKETLLPVRKVFYDHLNDQYKIYEAIQVKLISGFPTVIKSIMLSPLEETKTVLMLDLKNTAYNTGIPDSLFEVSALQSPPYHVTSMN
jgi:outer membrane lipoprotein-sorting protein